MMGVRKGGPCAYLPSCATDAHPVSSSSFPQLSISRIESAFAVPLCLALMPLASHNRKLSP
ncbi:hypothetical protein N658DRAFT_159636 [Parathielavia hyrcaniae]|uniref:Uncharacterized protein n=1 Tax=Parathielavia hyrcaniae TaxID=113614 RepID=A0AAN6PQ47_9PEZI|nr:hypothetical protein N658DRAFT_159636 [Parathielavia hyrcaniae]